MKFISVDIDFLDIYSKNLDEECKDFHLKMAEIFGFPAFYGKNLAALIDCLSDLRTFGDEEPMTRYSLDDDECVLLNVRNLSKASDDLRRKFLLALEAVNTRLSADKTPTILVNLTSRIDLLQEIRTSCEPAVIGVRNGLYQTEFIDAKSFPSKDVKDKFADVFTNSLNLSAFKDEGIKAFALKRAKQTDIVSCDSGIFDLDFLISQKAADVIKSFKINNLIKVPVEIDGWSGKYFAVSFPKYGVNIVNFPESIFVYQDYDNEQRKFIDIVRSINAPDEYGYLMTQIVPRKISLSQKVEDKAFHINGMGLFFSRDILDAFLSEQISGFSLHDAFVLA